MSPRTVADAEPLWRALADPTRRALLDALRPGPRTTGDLATGFPTTRFAVMKHLGVLVDAGLVTVERRGRERLNHLNPVPLREAYERWVRPFGDVGAAVALRLADAAEVADAGVVAGADDAGDDDGADVMAVTGRAARRTPDAGEVAHAAGATGAGDGDGGTALATTRTRATGIPGAGEVAGAKDSGKDDGGIAMATTGTTGTVMTTGMAASDIPGAGEVAGADDSGKDDGGIAMATTGTTATGTAMSNSGAGGSPYGIDVRAEHWTAAPPERAWRALLRLGDWWPPCWEDGERLAVEPRLGGRLGTVPVGAAGFDDADGGELWGVVSALRPGREMAVDGTMGIPGPVVGRWRLTLRPQDDGRGGGTVITLVHRVLGPVDDDLRGAFATRWPGTLAALATASEEEAP